MKCFDVENTVMRTNLNKVSILCDNHLLLKKHQ